ncbi:probable very-long-chain enoyl-CoA reductase art-1 [Contarinia nasturtii]|uniref:probable very-long-chain enoyl-CoA reductase art-1 n=1 Tax=Contarinia nasturtii TaxID=265458 RepID=UPI0012D40298|nr:probable very-long-chain enoyl-CoA reductase art-1 [Contarinia nasturtii]
MDIEILYAHNSKSAGKLNLPGTATVADVKVHVHKLAPNLYAERQAIRLEARGKTLKDNETLQSLNLRSGSKLYVKDLGPQIGWSTVFLCEYAGPLAVYLFVYQRPWIFFGNVSEATYTTTQHIAAACYAIHYVKRLYETIFVHRFSHATMPLSNLFKNCTYYWGFTAYVAYHVCHPLYTPPSTLQTYIGLGGFALCELGNLATHIALRNLRPPGTRVRKIPVPDWNPLTNLFNYVSCPNYTYEVGSWICFSILTNCIPAFLFAFAGFYQMAIWALGKHRNYKNEFKNYPKQRKAIIPFVL